MRLVTEDLIWHDFDERQRTLRVAFLNDDAITVFKYRLCPRCGVTMGEEDSPCGSLWRCAICGVIVKDDPRETTG